MYISKPTELPLRRLAESTLFLTLQLFTLKSNTFGITAYFSIYLRDPVVDAKSPEGRKAQIGKETIRWGEKVSLQIQLAIQAVSMT